MKKINSRRLVPFISNENIGVEEALKSISNYLKHIFKSAKDQTLSLKKCFYDISTSKDFLLNARFGYCIHKDNVVNLDDFVWSSKDGSNVILESSLQHCFDPEVLDKYLEYITGVDSINKLKDLPQILNAATLFHILSKRNSLDLIPFYKRLANFNDRSYCQRSNDEIVTDLCKSLLSCYSTSYPEFWYPLWNIISKNKINVTELETAVMEIFSDRIVGDKDEMPYYVYKMLKDISERGYKKSPITFYPSNTSEILKDFTSGKKQEIFDRIDSDIGFSDSIFLVSSESIKNSSAEKLIQELFKENPARCETIVVNTLNRVFKRGKRKSKKFSVNYKFYENLVDYRKFSDNVQSLILINSLS